MLEALAALLPLGALGISTALAAVPGKPAVQKDQAVTQDVAFRLQAIRSAVSQATADQAGLEPGDPRVEKAWWGNFHPGWGGWRNGGWGWHNGGWGWRNGWPNWRNGWPNWGNGWRNGGWPNFWRNW
ncbi:MAG TPA: GrrA/OscA1 family cyclophane-containing rSAM-modified RiPP [Rhodopila sp.]|uniref:GrrA/OscA1 family cyclophane-containing rSAM-modified RiPP n=1 Tax=Rhodopila sp. TaxID=2480087 RepID=UPI002BB59F7E|nr:GrrA/OscA1 family cyclophane-containing rSAM-modified RiPP [Rhodopila sp.]HVY16963.1 GrrA/OscA1 family cyclophane-containing rSAM-modified RiPP [Rhodopila sp.]